MHTEGRAMARMVVGVWWLQQRVEEWWWWWWWGGVNGSGGAGWQFAVEWLIK